VEPRLFEGAKVYDVGGGRRACIPLETKEKLSLRVVGLDISARELSLAPAGSYDQIVCADVTAYEGHADADIAICETLLEHVVDNELAFRALASIVKPGGLLLLFVPSRRAMFARLNVALPEELKRQVLFLLHPKSRGKQGFPAYYDRCTPGEFRELAARHGFFVEEERLYWRSEYFAFFAPLYMAWRGWVLASRAVLADDAAETFSLALRKPALAAA
jgi:2-polyprenyl-6-hydroxyphenyl methylase/3-demethylubiquinone-9 3-methyltransferase